MAYAFEIPITLAGKRRIDASVHGHLIRTDQPIAKGGDDQAPSPYDLFLASIGTCAGIIVQGFCAKRGLPFEDIAIVEEVTFDDDGVLTGVDIALRLPEGFPQRYVMALHRAVDTCPVARSILARPRFRVTSHEGDVIQSSAAPQQLPLPEMACLAAPGQVRSHVEPLQLTEHESVHVT